MAIRVMVNGLPGKMASEVARAVYRSDDFTLARFSFCSPRRKESFVPVDGVPFNVALVLPGQREDYILSTGEDDSWLVMVDYTRPDAVRGNVEFYCRHGCPFVLGTTGHDDRSALERLVQDSGNVAVIAPNMAKQIVAFQAMMQYAAENFPNSFAGYELEIKESHQKGKKDTSGTARAMADDFNQLGIPFAVGQIRSVREPSEQLAMGIPEDALSGHGWHTYTLNSADGTVLFRFTHNVNGRSIYAEGTLSALRFLQQKVDEGAQGRVFSMIDVLKSGF